MRILSDIANFQLTQIIVFGSLFLGAYYFSWYNDGSTLKKSIDDIQTNTQQVELQVNKKQGELENIKSFEKEVLAQEEDVKYFLNFIPSSLTFTDISTLLLREAKSSGVNVGLKKDEKVDKEEDSEYQTLSVQLAINGSFSQILLFLSKLTQQRRMLIVENIDMIINRQTQLIDAKLLVSAYRHDKKSKEKEEQ